MLDQCSANPLFVRYRHVISSLLFWENSVLAKFKIFLGGGKAVVAYTLTLTVSINGHFSLPTVWLGKRNMFPIARATS